MLHQYQAGTITERLKRGNRMRKNRIKGAREKAIEISRVSISDTATIAAHYLSPSAFFVVLNQFAIMGKYSFLFLVVNQFYRF